MASRPPRKTASRQQQRPLRKISPVMGCDEAFRIAAQSCLRDIVSNQASACDGSMDALHRIRIALTRLRTFVSFFSPIVADPEWIRLKRELKWLNGHLGAARDMDVLMMQFDTANREQFGMSAQTKAQRRKWISCHGRVTRVLKSKRHQLLLQGLSHWIDKNRQSDNGQRTESIAAYSARRLSRWQKKLLKKSRHLETMSTEMRHKLRIATKRMRYATEFFGQIASPHHPRKREAMLKHLRRAQETLGDLNDATRISALMNTPPDRSPANGHQSSETIESSASKKDSKALLQTAAAAFRKMEKTGAF